VAVDGSGNVFVVDCNNARVVEIPADGSPQRTIASGFNSPHGVAVDGSGDVFVADAFAHQVVEFPVIAPSAAQSTISASPSIPADGSTASTITVQAKDANGSDETSGGANVEVSTTLGTVSSVTDNGDGTYSATLTSTQAGTADVSATINGQAITSGDASLTITPGPASGNTSTITANPTTVSDNGTAAATITVQAEDANGNDETMGGQTVVLHSTLGKLSAVTDQGNGTYTATLTSTKKGTAELSATINGQRITSGDAHVAFVKLIAPTVTGVSPASGPVSGGTQITLTGTGFTSGATVVIGQGYGPNNGTIAAADVQFVSSSELIVTTGPQAKAGTFNVFVTTATGTSAKQAGDRFTYTRP
jgi:adhesin/invasin